jgi:hypothetical protein
MGEPARYEYHSWNLKYRGPAVGSWWRCRTTRSKETPIIKGGGGWLAGGSGGKSQKNIDSQKLERYFWAKKQVLGLADWLVVPRNGLQLIITLVKL